MPGNKFRTPKRSRSGLWSEALAVVVMASILLGSVGLFLYTLDSMAAQAEAKRGVHQVAHTHQQEPAR